MSDIVESLGQALTIAKLASEGKKQYMIYFCSQHLILMVH